MAGRANERNGCIGAAECAGFVKVWPNTLRYAAQRDRSGSTHRMKPPPFEYRVADSLEAAIGMLAESGGEAKVLAGGQSLVPMLNFRLLRPSILVDINRIPGLADIKDTGREIRVGALTRHHQLESSP